MSDEYSVTALSSDIQKSISAPQNSRKRYKQWTDEDEQKLISLLNKTQKSIKDLNDSDWSQMAQ